MNLDDTIGLWRKVYERGYALDRHDLHTRAEIGRCLASITRPARLLDLGCGHCEWLDVYLDHGAEADLVDTVDLSARFAGVKGATFRQADALQLAETLDRDYDLVVVSKLIHNIPREHHRRLMALVTRAISPGGLSLISVASTSDPARLLRDRPLSPNGAREYLTGVAHGRSAYRCYFGDEDVDELVNADLELLSKEEFSAPSGIPGHEPRWYWQLLLRRRQAAGTAAGSTDG